MLRKLGTYIFSLMHEAAILISLHSRMIKAIGPAENGSGIAWKRPASGRARLLTPDRMPTPTTPTVIGDSSRVGCRCQSSGEIGAMRDGRSKGESRSNGCRFPGRGLFGESGRAANRCLPSEYLKSRITEMMVGPEGFEPPTKGL